VVDVREIDVRDVDDRIDLTASPDRSDVPARRRLLIVDDEPDVLGWLRIALEPLRWDVNGARNIVEAQEMALRLQPDVILLDQHLPDGAGIDLGRWLREHRPATAVLMFSAYIDPATASEAERLGITTLSKRDHRVLISSLSVIRATLDARVAKR
jgi:two-component system response regulator (stage 0 sporulation protein F)